MLQAADTRSPDADAALAALCETYWSPVYAFVRRSGSDHEDALDLTQAFFARLMEGGYLKAVRPERGRFRSFLLTAVRNFQSHARKHDRALKRGGGVRHISIDTPVDSDGFEGVLIADQDTPDQAFERNWALACFESAVAHVRAEYGRTGKGALFETLKPAIQEHDGMDYATVASTLGCSEGAARVAAHRLRRSVATALRNALAQTVAEQDDVNDELRFLMGALARK